MNKRQLDKEIDAAYKRVEKQIADNTDKTSHNSRGLSYEGYYGGYLQALSDVSARLRDVPVSWNTTKFWKD